MKRRGLAICLVLLAGNVVISGTACVPQVLPPGSGGNNTSTGGSNNPGSGPAADVFERVNEIRVANGLAALTWNGLLADAAMTHAKRMADLNFFAHEDPHNGTLPWDRAEQAGYVYTMVAENIAAGQRSAAEVMNGWMNSPGHRENILRAEVTELGVALYEGGTYGTYWVQVFGTPGN